VQHILLDDSDALDRELRTQVKGKPMVKLDGQHMAGARGQCSCDGPGAWTDLDHGAPGEIAQRSGNPLGGLRIVEEVLSELGFQGHGYPSSA